MYHSHYIYAIILIIYSNKSYELWAWIRVFQKQI